MSACIDQGNGLTGVVQRLCWILGVQLDLAHNLSLNVQYKLCYAVTQGKH